MKIQRYSKVPILGIILKDDLGQFCMAEDAIKLEKEIDSLNQTKENNKILQQQVISIEEIIKNKNEYIIHQTTLNNELFNENVFQKHLLKKEIIWNRNLSIGIIASATLLLLSKLI